MNKLIEKAMLAAVNTKRDAIGQVPHRTTLKDCNNRTLEELEAQVIAIIDALGVVILPADAEPEVGDLVTFGGSDTHLLRSEKAVEWAIKTGTKIIQRNGKPVIMEKADE